MSESRLVEALGHLAQAIAMFAQAGAPQHATIDCTPAAFDGDDAAKYLGIGRTKLLEYRNAGDLKTVMVGGRPKYLRKDLDRLLAKLEKA